MMLHALQEYGLQHAVRHVRPRSKRFINYKKMKNIMLIFDSDAMERNEAIKNIIVDLQEARKRVVAWGYADKKIINSPILPTFNLICRADLDFMMRPKKAVIQALQEMHFDCVINFSDARSIPTTHLLLNTDADCKIGYVTSLNATSGSSLYDFSICYAEDELPQVDEEDGNDRRIRHLWNTLLPYLQTIQS
ncbi:MAG: hypothetical protein IJ680_08440 [Paludibacteraceae bacterium]|nr:hypothetical protein [Paludibacteraceae bacterium]